MTSEESGNQEQSQHDLEAMAKEGNIFGRRSMNSESSGEYTLRSAPKFGGLKTTSDRGSVTMSFRGADFKQIDPGRANVNANSRTGSILDYAISQNDLEHQ